MENLLLILAENLPVNLVIVVGGIFLFREINNVKKIVSNGLSHRVREMSKQIDKLDGYVTGLHDHLTHMTNSKDFK